MALTFNYQDFLDDKLSILDVKAKDATGSIFNIEMQLTVTAGLVKPVVFYGCELYAGQLSKGDYQAQIVRRRFSPKRLKRKLQQSYQNWDRLIETLPSDLADMLRQIKRGKFDVHLEHRRLESTVNRLVMGLLASALFVGSAQLWSLQVPPTIAGFSIPGALGCAIAVGLGFRLLHAIKKSGDIIEKRPL